VDKKQNFLHTKKKKENDKDLCPVCDKNLYYNEKYTQRIGIINTIGDHEVLGWICPHCKSEVIKYVDCSVLEGHRGEERQNKLFDEGKTKVKYPNGRHNAKPSRAVDVVPYPVDWKDRERFHLFAGFVLGIARSMDIKLRWGGDWNMNFEVDDNKFDDFPHFELLKE
jgi:peptidoglycan L-alanyl-D-glutamate endopeptidase CwlK